MDIDLSELNLQNIPDWPKPVKIAAVAFVCAILVFLAYWFDTKEQIKDLNNLEYAMSKLKTTFEEKQHKAANLGVYESQMQQMKETYGTLLKQLPEKTEVPGLVEDISHQGLSAGLEFKSIKLLPEKKVDFYAELAINIEVEGNYHQLAEFVSNVASLPRIVTLHDFAIKKVDKNPDSDLLNMNITTKTYRYIGDE